MSSGTYNLKVVIPPTGWLGHLILRLALRPNTTLRIQMPNAPVQPFVEDADEHDSFPTVVPNDDTRGFTIYLGSAMPRSGEWRWAEVSWKLTHLPEHGTFPVSYEWDHPKRAVRGLIWLLVRTPGLVKQLRVLRK